MSTRRLKWVLLSALLCLLTLGTSSAQATTGLLQNDTFTSNSTFTCRSGLEIGDTVGAAYAAPAASYPIQITGLQLLVCGSASATLDVAIYADSLDDTANPDSLIWASETGYPLAPSTGFNEIDLTSQDIVVPSGGLRVAIIEDGSDAVALGTDDDGIVAHRNFVRTTVQGWNFAETFGIMGDWIVRAEYEPLPGPLPDAKIRRSNDVSSIGNDVYEPTPDIQIRKWSAKRHQTRSFVVGLENDGLGSGPLTVHGCASTTKFKVAYLEGATDVTPAVTNGSYETDSLPPSDDRDLELRVTPKKRTGTLACDVVASAAGELDTVRAQLKTKR